jgi:hypothetical protein
MREKILVANLFCLLLVLIFLLVPSKETSNLMIAVVIGFLAGQLSIVYIIWK